MLISNGTLKQEEGGSNAFRVRSATFNSDFEEKLSPRSDSKMKSTKKNASAHAGETRFQVRDSSESPFIVSDAIFKIPRCLPKSQFPEPRTHKSRSVGSRKDSFRISNSNLFKQSTEHGKKRDILKVLKKGVFSLSMDSVTIRPSLSKRKVSSAFERRRTAPLSQPDNKKSSHRPNYGFSLSNRKLENHSSVRDMTHEVWGHWSQPELQLPSGSDNGLLASRDPIATLERVSLVTVRNSSSNENSFASPSLCGPGSGKNEDGTQVVSSPEMWLQENESRIGREDLCVAFALHLSNNADVPQGWNSVVNTTASSSNGSGFEIPATSLSSYHLLRVNPGADNKESKKKDEQDISFATHRGSVSSRTSVIETLQHWITHAGNDESEDDSSWKLEMRKALRLRLVIGLGDGPTVANFEQEIEAFEKSGAVRFQLRRGARFVLVDVILSSHPSRILLHWMRQAADGQLDLHWSLEKKREPRVLLASARVRDVNLQRAQVVFKPSEDSNAVPGATADRSESASSS